MPAERLADQDSGSQRELLDRRDGIRDECFPRDVAGAPLAPPVPTLVERDHPVRLAEPLRRLFPLPGGAGEPMQQEDARAFAPEVQRLEPGIPAGDRDPPHAGVSRSFGGSLLSSESAPAPAARQATAASGQSASGSAARMKPPMAGPRRKPRSQEFVETAM